MVTSKDNLSIFSLVGKDKSNALLANIHITEDGTTVSCNGKTVLLLQGVPTERIDSVPFKPHSPQVNRDITLPLSFVEKIVKGIPLDKTFDGRLEMLHIGEEDSSVVITSHDGSGEKILKGKEFKQKYIDFRGIIQKLFVEKEIQSRFVLDRKRMISTLQAMDKICGDSPSYIEVTEDGDLGIRSYLPRTGQEVFALVTGIVSEWKEPTSFLGKLLNPGGSIKKKKKKKKRKKVVK